jgi:YfiH family protein
MPALIFPQWPQPDSVRSCSTTRQGGVSLPPYASLNLGSHVSDCPEHVATNRQRLIELASLPAAPHWLEQVHGTDVARLTQTTPHQSIRVDAAYTDQPGVVCAAMSADCLPVLFCNRAGDEVSAAHAGWRGLNAGVLENTLSAFRAKPQDIMVWLGPAIGPDKFEVGAEVRDAFIDSTPKAAGAFSPLGPKYLANLYQLARLRLQASGVEQIFGGDRCTVSETDYFFSYRRDGITGRLATLIWLR